MLQYAASDNMLVDYFTQEHQGNFDLHIPKDQCAYVQFSDGREGFLDAGNHAIRMGRYTFWFHKPETITMYWFNLSDHIDLHLSDTVQVMEPLLRTVDQELKLYAPVETRVDLDLTVRIADREALLDLLLSRQAEDYEPVMDKQNLTDFLKEKLHYVLEKSVNSCKRQNGTDLFHMDSLSESVEIALIGDICSRLEAIHLEMVAAHITQITPTQTGMSSFREKEAETLIWYNQVQMDSFRRSQTSRRKKDKAAISATPSRSSVFQEKRLRRNTGREPLPYNLQALLAQVS